MTDNTDGVTVDLDAPTTEEGKAATAEQGIADLKQQVAQLQQKGEQEAARNRELEQENRRLSSAAAEAQRETLETTEKQIDADINGLKGQLKDALETGDYEKHTELSTKLAEKIAERNQVQAGKAELKRQGADPAGPVDKQEKYISGFPAKSQEFLREHRDYITDPTKNALMIAGHHEAVARKIEVESPEYFDFIKSKVEAAGESPSYSPPPPPPPPAARREAPSLAAPPSRDPPRPNGQQNGRTVTLTAAEVEAAEVAGVSPAEYAAQKAALTASGQIGPGAPHNRR